jgi:hypothetical protein
MSRVLEKAKQLPKFEPFSTCWETTGCPRSNFLSCTAYQQRKNCYEVDRVVCCTKHRDNCSSCSVYISINKVPTQRIRVRIITDGFEIIGRLHIPAGNRLSDYLNRAGKAFLTITDAEVRSLGGNTQIQEKQVVFINKNTISMIQDIN